MNILVVLMCIIGINSMVDAEDNIDGNKLAQELRKIKEDIGVNHMQVIYIGGNKLSQEL